MPFLLPDIEIVPGDQPVPIPAMETWPARPKRAIQMVPILVGLGVAAAVGTGTAGLGISLDKYTKLAHQVINDMEAVSQSLQEIQDQIDSLAEVVLQNRRGLDLLTAEKGGICLALKELYKSPLWTAWHGFLPYLLPLSFFLLLSAGPCVFAG